MSQRYECYRNNFYHHIIVNQIYVALVLVFVITTAYLVYLNNFNLLLYFLVAKKTPC